MSGRPTAAISLLYTESPFPPMITYLPSELCIVADGTTPATLVSLMFARLFQTDAETLLRQVFLTRTCKQSCTMAVGTNEYRNLELSDALLPRLQHATVKQAKVADSGGLCSQHGLLLL